MLSLSISNVLAMQHYKLIVTTDKESYVIGDIITIEVKVLIDSMPAKGVIVGVELRNPRNDPVLLLIKRTDDNGIARVLIKTNEKWPTGKYVVWVALSGTRLKSTTSFLLIGLGPRERVFIVFDDNGLPLIGAEVAILNSEGKEIAKTTTKSDGIATLNLTAGNYTVKVIWGGTVVYESTMKIELLQYRFVLNCSVYSLRITVIEMFTKRLLVKAPVSLELPNGTILKAFTNEVGVVTFQQVPKGTHKLTIANKVITVTINKNTEITVEVEPQWLWLLPVVIAIIIIAVIYVVMSRRRKR